MKLLQLQPIGKVSISNKSTSINLTGSYLPALKGLEGFSHLNIIWWFSDYADTASRNTLKTERPYKTAPEVLGIFATRSPLRPNPLALTTVAVLYIDYNNGIIHIPYIDASNETPVLDIKPYTPSLDRVEKPAVPEWCRHWPENLEASASFDWEQEFNF